MKAGAFAKRDLARRRFVGEYTKGAKARAAADLKKVRLLLAQLRGVDLRTATYLTAITFPLELQARRGLTNNLECVLMAGQQKSILDMTVLLLEQTFQTPQPKSLGLLRATEHIPGGSDCFRCTSKAAAKSSCRRWARILQHMRHAHAMYLREPMREEWAGLPLASGKGKNLRVPAAGAHT